MPSSMLPPEKNCTVYMPMGVGISGFISTVADGCSRVSASVCVCVHVCVCWWLAGSRQCLDGHLLSMFSY